MQTMSKPRLPVAAKRLGATKIDRFQKGRNVFGVSYKLDDAAGYNAPGFGQEIMDALVAVWGDVATISWDGCQVKAIIVDFDTVPA